MVDTDLAGTASLSIPSSSASTKECSPKRFWRNLKRSLSPRFELSGSLFERGTNQGIQSWRWKTLRTASRN